MRSATVFVLVVCAAAAAAAASARPAASTGVGVASGHPAFRDTVLSGTRLQALRARSEFWGGPFTASSGETVTIFFSDLYPQDPAEGTKWASFLASLAHGGELQSVRVYLAPIDEVGRTCGAQALACYDPDSASIIAPRDDVQGLSARSILMHEYGHHVAANRDNSPWTAVDWGTKRWASYMNVCARTEARELFPGDESEERYQLNPGEGLAESYRVLNERAAGLPETPWQIVSQTLYPDTTALDLLRQDVLDPWDGNTSSTIRGSVSRAGRSARTFTVATKLDGTLRVTLRAPSSARVRVELLTSSGTRLGRTAVAGGARTLGTTICGSRSYRVRITRLTGAGAFRLTVSKP